MSVVTLAHKSLGKITAIQFTGDNHGEVLNFLYPGLPSGITKQADNLGLPIIVERPNAEESMKMSEGEWAVSSGDSFCHVFSDEEIKKSFKEVTT